MREVLIASIVAIVLAAMLAAQDARSVVRGTVSDPGGGPVPGVTVTATDEITGQTFTTVTDGNGQYRLELPPGRYTFRVELSGFKTHRLSGVTVKGPRDVNIALPAGTKSRPGQKAKPPQPPPPPPPPPPPVGSEKPAPTGTARGGPRETAVSTLAWNTWPDSYPGPTYRPVPHFQPNQDYLIVLHLSGLPYRDAGVFATPASGDVSGWIDDWMKAGQLTAPLQVLLLPDTNYFNVVDGRVKRLDVDLKALRDWTKTPAAAVAEPLSEVRRARELGGGLPNFVFGEVPLRVHTTNRQGIGAVAVSIWSDAGRPLDEITLNYCISSSPEPQPAICSGIQPVQQTLKGTDSVRVAAEGDATPDAALHFLELDNRGVIGVFRENKCADCGYHVWTLGRNGEDLRSYLANTVLPTFGPTATTKSLSDAGQGLYNLLFPSDDADKDRSEARAAFERFVEQDLTSEPPRRPARSIFVRTLLSDAAFARPLYLPLGLITTPAAPEEFLGFRFRIEAPLERQSYRAGTTCISRWFFAVPPANPQSTDALAKARQKVETLMTAWGPRMQPVFDTIPKLRSWLLAPKPAEASAALVVLSHHDQSTVYFDQTEKLTAPQVQRRFGEASVLVLDGCSTGAPMAVDLLRQFNERGVATTIASQVAVRPELAGDFIATLGEQIDGGDAKGSTIADVFLRTLQELRLKQADDTALPYGPRALVFSLLGNGATRICSPQKEVP